MQEGSHAARGGQSSASFPVLLAPFSRDPDASLLYVIMPDPPLRLKLAMLSAT